MEQIQLTQLSLDDLKNILDEVISEHLKDVKKEQSDQLFTRKELAERLDIEYKSIQSAKTKMEWYPITIWIHIS